MLQKYYEYVKIPGDGDFLFYDFYEKDKGAAMLQVMNITGEKTITQKKACRALCGKTRHPHGTVRVLAALFLMLFLAVGMSVSSSAAAVHFRAKIPRTKLLRKEQVQIQFTNTKRITYRFKSSNKKVFTVTKQGGLIKAKKAGTAVLTITGTWKKGSKKETWKKQVKIEVFSCRLSKKNISLKQSKTKKLSVKGLKLKRRITWYSQTPEICSVSADGRVSALRKGNGIVCAQVGEYLVLQCRVQVTVTALKGSGISLLVNATHTYGAVDLAVEMQNAVKSTKEVSLTVSNPLVGHLSGNIYFADKHGTNSVTASCDGYEKVFTITQLAWCAHRGYSDMYPENTIDAFEGAALAGAGFIETDIHVTKDGEIVCMHDKYLANMTDAPVEAEISNMTLEEIRALQINNGNCLENLVHKQVPTLMEYLQICRRYGIVAVIEMKSLGGTVPKRLETSQKIVRLLEAAGMKDRCIVISPSAALLKTFRNGAGEAGASIPIGPTNNDAWEIAKTYGLSNIFASYKSTAFGTMLTWDYSPLVGRKHRAVDTYHTRVRV